jgi:hypothetical protein
MENLPPEYSKFLDETNSHLSLQTIATYINLPEQLDDKEKQFISNHLAKCRKCMDSFDHVFDESIELEEKKNIISLYRRIEEQENGAVLFGNENGLVEIELTKLNETDFNLRFVSLPPGLKGEKGALMVNNKYILRILSMNMETLFIIHSEEDIMKLASLELISLAALPVISQTKEFRKDKKYYWYAAAAMVIIVLFALIYFITKTGEKKQVQSEKKQVVTSLTPGEKSVSESDTSTAKPTEPTEQDVVEDTQRIPPDYNTFAENITFENFINRKNTNGTRVAVTSPAIGQEVHMPVTFEWITASKNMTLKFEIITNLNNPVYNSLISGRELTIDTRLNPGLYYWKLESTDSVEAMGKFFIR